MMRDLYYESKLWASSFSTKVVVLWSHWKRSYNPNKLLSRNQVVLVMVALFLNVIVLLKEISGNTVLHHSHK